MYFKAEKHVLSDLCIKHSITLGVALTMTQIPAAVQKKITVLNQHNEKLVGVLHDTGSTEMVVLCHGFKSSKDFNTIVNLAVALEKEGISAFRFDFPGNGESEGSFQYGNYHGEADDLHSVVEYFNGANRKVMAILGHSKGGGVVLLYASKYHDVHTVINLSARYILEKGIARRLGEDFLEIIKKDGFIDVKNRAGDVDYRVTEESLMERINTNMHDACLQIDKGCRRSRVEALETAFNKNARVLTVHGSADEVVPVEDALEFDKIIPNHKLHIIEGADHCYTSHQAELPPLVLPFIKEGLQQN
ncbi:putative transcription factor-like isoform X1 [Capsicum annuum]|nr:putative transcription factor-like isoform X1 [Capsicum annuum]